VLCAVVLIVLADVELSFLARTGGEFSKMCCLR
jgi:hypothetical protein